MQKCSSTPDFKKNGSGYAANMSTRLQNQVAWVSGAASGMGEGIARLFAREGAAVALVDMQAAKGATVADQICAEGGRAIFVACDVGKEAAVRDSLERT